MLTLIDREEISRGLAEDLLFTEIAVRIGRDPSVVSRDVGRHGGRAGYRAVVADQRACAARELPEAARGRTLAAAAGGGVPPAAVRLVTRVDRGPVAHRLPRGPGLQGVP